MRSLRTKKQNINSNIYLYSCLIGHGDDGRIQRDELYQVGDRMRLHEGNLGFIFSILRDLVLLRPPLEVQAL